MSNSDAGASKNRVKAPQRNSLAAMTEKMNWQLLGPLLVTTLVAIVGWFVGDYLSNKRDLRDKAREVRVEYLINAYRRLEAAGSRNPGELGRYLEGFESAIADVQLFGSNDQVRLARELAYAIATRKPGASTGPLLLSLRDDLRNELGLEVTRIEPIHLRLIKPK